MLKKNWLYVVVALVIVVSILIGGYYYQQWRMRPVPNAHPKYFVTISGNIQPNMPYPQELVFRATYGAYAPACRVWIII